jgi:DNA-binding transcriptional regulator YiaG
MKPETIIKIRAKHGLTQGQLARVLGYSGAYHQTVLRWEKGTATPNGPASRMLGLILSGVVPAELVKEWAA